MIFLFFKLFRLIYKKKLLIKRAETDDTFFRTHFIILIFSFLFAFFSKGNVEFMVMIPILTVLTLFYYFQFNYRLTTTIAVFLIIWNVTYGLYPNNRYSYYNNEVVINYIRQHPDKTFLVTDSAIVNQFYYETGIDDYKNIIPLEKINSKEAFIELLDQHKCIYTDAVKKPEILNRSRLVSANRYKVDFSEFKIETILNYPSIYGNNGIYKVSKK